MKKLLFDIEANGLLEDVHTIWCISTINLDTHERVFFSPDRIQEALAYLSTATLLVGHNIIGYDIPALVKVTGWKPTCDIKDTLVMCQMIFADQSTDDRKHPDKRIQALDGSHSLEAWGLRLNCRKHDYRGGFDAYTDEMGLYCQQDTLTNEVIYRHCEKQHYSEEALALEQFIAHIYAGMERVGFGFDKDKALALQAMLDEKLVSLESEVAPYIVLGKEETNTPAYWEMTWPDGTTQQFETKTESEIVRKKLGHKPKQCVLTRGPNKCKSVNPYAGPSARNKPFNPGSGSQVRNYLHAAHGWLSPRLTPKGQRLSDAGGDYNALAKEYGQTSEEILRTLQWPEAKLFADAAMVKKVRSMVATGQQGWLKKVSPVDGRIHARFIGCACVTNRSSCCIEENQRVKTPDGDIPIKDIKVGQYVYSYTPENGWRMNKVLQVIDRGVSSVFAYNFVSRSGDCVLQCTPNHRIMTQDNGYIYAGELTKGTKIAYLHTAINGKGSNKRKYLYGTGYFSRQQSTFIKDQLYPDAYEKDMHHIDENKLNDSISNLIPLTTSEHSKSHKKRRYLLDRLPSKWAVLREIAKAKGSIRDVSYDFDTFKQYCKYYDIDEKVCAARYRKCGSVTKERTYVTKGELKRAALGAKSQNEIAQKLGTYQRTANKWFNAHGLGYLLPNTNNRIISKDDFIAALSKTSGNTKETAKLLGITEEGVHNRRKYYKIPSNHWYSHCTYIGERHVYDLHVERDNNFVCEEIVVHNSGPNLQQAPHVNLDKDKKPLWGFEGRYGADCRELFLPLPGEQQVGTDLSGIEARMLAHFLFYYDKGNYVKQILTGDIHALNCNAIKEFASYTIGRNDSKTPYYGFLYGIGPEKQGRQVCSVCDDAMQEFRERERYYTRKPDKIKRVRRVKGNKIPYRPAEAAFADVGEKVNRAFSKGIDGMEALLTDVQNASEKGYLNVLDRQLIVRKKHSALNTLLQGSAAIVMKRWVASLYKTIQAEGIRATLMGAIHDEVQASVAKEHVETYSNVTLATIKYAGEYYKLNIPLDGEVKVGNNWCECH